MRRNKELVIKVSKDDKDIDSMFKDWYDRVHERFMKFCAECKEECDRSNDVRGKCSATYEYGELQKERDEIVGICNNCSKDETDVVKIEVWWGYRTFVCKRCRIKS